MDRYDWDWNRGYGWPRYGGSYGRDYQGPGWWGGQGGRGYDRGEGWPWRRDEFSGGDRWRGRWAEGWERPRGGGYHGYGYGRPPSPEGGGWYGPDDPWAGERYGGGGWSGMQGGGWRGGYDSSPGSPFGRGAPGWGASYDRFRAPFDEDPRAGWDPEFDDDFGDEDPWDTGFQGRGNVELDDAEIRRRVWQNLMDDGFIDAGAMRIDVKDRVVTLRGEVADYMEARYAWDDAWDAEGVRGVISKLTISGDAREEAPPGAATKEPAPGAKPKSTGSRAKKNAGE